MISPAQEPSTGLRRSGPPHPATPASSRKGLRQPLALDAKGHRGGLPAWNHQTMQVRRDPRHAHLAHSGAPGPQHAPMRLEVPCRASTPTNGFVVGVGGAATNLAGRAIARRPASELSRLTIAGPSPREARATRSGSCQWVVASTIARARAGGSSDLKMPEPTNTPSAPSAIISAASAGVAMPPAQNSTTGSRPARATWRTRSSGAACCLAAAGKLSTPAGLTETTDLAGDAAHVAHRLDDIPGAGLALGADHRGALPYPPQCLAQDWWRRTRTAP